MLERTFCMIKPDAVRRGLESEIKQRILQAGFVVVSEQRMRLSIGLAEKLYAVHQGKKFYPGLIKFITSSEVALMVLEAENAIEKLRELMGATDPRLAEPGTIRCDLKEENVLTEDGIIKNLVHGSDSEDNAKYETGIFF